MRGNGKFLRRVGQHVIVQLNEGRARRAQSSNEIEQRRFARAGRTEDGGDAPLHRKIRFEREMRKRQRNVFQQQAHVVFLRRRKNSLLHTAMKASTTDTPSK